MEIRLQGDRDKLFNLDGSVASAIQLMLTDVSLLIQNSAKRNAPFLTGTLRRSINTDFNRIQKGIVVVGSPVKYARVREYINNKHPETRFYLERGYTENENEIKRIIKQDLSKELK